MIDLAAEDGLTILMNLFIDKCMAGAELIIPYALAMLGVLACIELALAFLFNAMDGSEDPIYLLVKRLIKYSFFIWLIQNWATGMRLSKQIFDWFASLGAQAAGSAQLLNKPSAIADTGVVLAASIIKSMLALGWGSIGLLLIKLLLLITIFLIFAAMAIYVFYTTLQFYVLGTLTTAMLPFGVNRHTQFLAQPAIGAICNVAIKMMFLQFALCIAAPYLDSVQPFSATDTDFSNALRVVIACIGMALFCIGTPQLASNYFSGSPTFGDGAAGSAGSAAGSAAVSTAAKAVGVPPQVAKMGMQAVGMVQAAANAPGGRTAGGKIDKAGTARNLGKMARQSMPDRQAQWQGKSLFNMSRNLEKDRKNNEAQKNQTNLF